MLYIKKHAYQGKHIIALCDEELIGKHFLSDGLSLHISEQFYKGELIEESALSAHLANAYLVNLAGKKALLACKSLGLVDDAQVLTVDGIPHAQVLIIAS